jgi:hypothetical protein|nr:MAG TPA: hypothetical protein [Caudoviricetes sp.]DAX50254.1 MAG TPA: hypothetical protein [Caudoviricetes sp.]
MKTHDLRKLLEAVPYDFEVKVIGNCGVKEAAIVKVDFERKVLTIGVE